MNKQKNGESLDQWKETLIITNSGMWFLYSSLSVILLIIIFSNVFIEHNHLTIALAGHLGKSSIRQGPCLLRRSQIGKGDGYISK